MQGEGVYKSASGNVYLGFFNDNMFHGYGVMQVCKRVPVCCFGFLRSPLPFCSLQMVIDTRCVSDRVLGSAPGLRC